MGPCLCGDPYCGSCGNPAGMARMDAEMDRIERRVGDDFNFLNQIECSCGRVMVAGEYPNGAAVYLYRTCMNCYDADHSQPDLEPDYHDEDTQEEPY
jgi:hypothetical protein